MFQLGFYPMIKLMRRERGRCAFPLEGSRVFFTRERFLYEAMKTWIAQSWKKMFIYWLF